MSQQKEGKTKNLIEGLIDEMNRVRGLIKMYEELPDNVGFVGACIMKVSIKEAEATIVSGNIIEMLRSYENLKGHE